MILEWSTLSLRSYEDRATTEPAPSNWIQHFDRYGRLGVCFLPRILVQRQPPCHTWLDEQAKSSRSSVKRSLALNTSFSSSLSSELGCILAILSDSLHDRSCRSTRIANNLLPKLPPFLSSLQSRPSSINQMVIALYPSMDNTDPGRLRLESLPYKGETLMQIRSGIPKNAAQVSLKVQKSQSYDGTVQL